MINTTAPQRRGLRFDLAATRADIKPTPTQDAAPSPVLSPPADVTPWAVDGHVKATANRHLPQSATANFVVHDGRARHSLPPNPFTLAGNSSPPTREKAGGSSSALVGTPLNTHNLMVRTQTLRGVALDPLRAETLKEMTQPAVPASDTGKMMAEVRRSYDLGIRRTQDVAKSPLTDAAKSTLASVAAAPNLATGLETLRRSPEFREALETPGPHVIFREVHQHRKGEIAALEANGSARNYSNVIDICAELQGDSVKFSWTMTRLRASFSGGQYGLTKEVDFVKPYSASLLAPSLLFAKPGTMASNMPTLSSQSLSAAVHSFLTTGEATPTRAR